MPYFCELQQNLHVFKPYSTFLFFQPALAQGYMTLLVTKQTAGPYSHFLFFWIDFPGRSGVKLELQPTSAFKENRWQLFSFGTFIPEHSIILSLKLHRYSRAMFDQYLKIS